MLKKIFLLSVICYLTSGIFTPKASATCFTISDPQYSTCMGGTDILFCPGPPSYCCTDTTNDVCPGSPSPSIAPSTSPASSPTPTPQVNPYSFCTSLNVSPNPGPTGSTFNVVGEGCQSSYVDTFVIKVYENSGIGSLIFSSSISVSTTPSNFSVPITTNLIPGYYSVEITEDPGSRDVDTILLIVTTSGALQCCDIDPDNCTIINFLTDKCPTECPMESAMNGEVKCMRRFPITPTPKPLVPPWFCNVSGNTASGIDTGLGCTTFCAGTFAAKALGWSTVTTSGIAFIVILVAIGMFIMSAGDSKKIQAAKELLYSALGGVFLIAIGIVLLNAIGVNILKLDKLGFDLDATCKPISFEPPPPTPTRIPTSMPTITKVPSTPIPSVTPLPTPIPPTPTPWLRYACCTRRAASSVCKLPSECIGSCTGSCGGSSCPTCCRCASTICVETKNWCNGQSQPLCTDPSYLSGRCN